MRRIFILFVFAFWEITTPIKILARSNDTTSMSMVAQWTNSSGIRFLENKGQMMDMQRKAVPNVLYEASGGGMNVYITTWGLSYVFDDLKRFKKKNRLKSKEHNDSIIETYCRADMELIGANIRKENIVKEGESENRTDYYYGDICPNGILGVHSYEKMTIKNIYPGIDWVLLGEKNGLKYDFIVHPGADPSVITLRYKWTNKPKLQADGSIKINTPMGNITEGTPASYSDNKQVQTAYIIENNEIHFKVDNYNTTQTLTIDPVLVWATYYDNGINEFDDVYSMQEDGRNVWITGLTESTNFPTFNPGGGSYFQGTFTGNYKLFILKFNTSGVLKWATYYGGSGYDLANSIYTNGKNVWVTGGTTSTNFPTFNPGGGSYFQGVPAGNNSFILQFDTVGVRKWATYYGGNDYDVGNSIYSDGESVWVAGLTESTNFPTLNPGGGAYFQGTLGSPNGNVFILQFNINRVLKWATYYGGSGADKGASIQSDGVYVWVTGYASSANFPTLNPGSGAYFQGTLAGTENAFILQFDTDGVRKWATYYGGSGVLGDQGYSIYSDGTNVYLTGATSSINFPVLNPGGRTYFQGGLGSSNGNAFVLQFDTAGVRKWATFYGGNGNKQFGDIGYSIQSDVTNVWVCGTTCSTNFPTINLGCGFYQDTLGRNTTQYSSQDVFVSEFSKNGICKWATYYGTDNEDDDSYVWSDGISLFVAGDAHYKGYPTLNPGGGAYYLDTATSQESIFIGKFIIGSLSVNPTASICRGGSTTLTASGAISYTWSPPTGISATNVPNPIATPTVTTTYTVMGIDTGTCGGTFIDSVKVVVDTLNLKDVTLTHDTTICSGNSIILNANGGTGYNWSTGATTSSISITSLSYTQTYTLSISNGACVKDTNMTVTVAPLPKTIVMGNTQLCQGGNLQLNVTGGNTYLWSNGYIGSAYTAVIDSSTTLTITAYNSSGCAHDTTITITPNIPLLSACCEAVIQVGNDTILVAKGNSALYQWSPQVTCLNPPMCDSVRVSPSVTTTYTVMITDSAGCEVERTLVIDVELPCSNFIVPNVFTPNYQGPNGVNSIFYIETNNLDSWSLNVYDRWGKEVYNSNSPNRYWDGNTESGGKAPDGVYFYIINTICQGISYKKDGFVQLIR